MRHRLIATAGARAATALTVLMLGFAATEATAQSTDPMPPAATQSTADGTATNAQLQAQIRALRAQVAKLQKAGPKTSTTPTPGTTEAPVKEQDTHDMGKHMQEMAKHMQEMGKRMEQKGMKMEKGGSTMGMDKAKMGMDMGAMDKDMDMMNKDGMDKDM